MFQLQIVTKLNKRGQIHIYCHKETKDSIIYPSYTFWYTLKLSSVDNECPLGGSNEQGLSNSAGTSPSTWPFLLLHHISSIHFVSYSVHDGTVGSKDYRNFGYNIGKGIKEVLTGNRCQLLTNELAVGIKEHLSMSIFNIWTTQHWR